MISGKENEKQIMDKSKNISRIPSEMKSFKKDRRLSLFSAKDIWSICEPPGLYW